MTPRGLAARHWLIALALPGLVSCATGAPSTTVVGRTTRLDEPGLEIETYNETRGETHVVPLTLELAWVRLRSVFAQLAIPVTISDASRSQMGNQNHRVRRLNGKRLSTYLDCGSSASVVSYADEYDITIGVLTTLEREGTSTTAASTIVTASAKAREVSAYPFDCVSRGTLEREIARLLTVPPPAAP